MLVPLAWHPWTSLAGRLAIAAMDLFLPTGPCLATGPLGPAPLLESSCEPREFFPEHRVLLLTLSHQAALAVGLLLVVCSPGSMIAHFPHYSCQRLRSERTWNDCLAVTCDGFAQHRCHFLHRCFPGHHRQVVVDTGHVGAVLTGKLNTSWFHHLFHEDFAVCQSPFLMSVLPFLFLCSRSSGGLHSDSGSQNYRFHLLNLSLFPSSWRLFSGHAPVFLWSVSTASLHVDTCRTGTHQLGLN